MSDVPGNKERAVALLRALASGDACVAVTLFDPYRRVDVVRVLADGDRVVAHGREGDEMFFAAFRFADGLIAETWRALPAPPPNASGLPQELPPRGLEKIPPSAPSGGVKGEQA